MTADILLPASIQNRYRESVKKGVDYGSLASVDTHRAYQVYPEPEGSPVGEESAPFLMELPALRNIEVLGEPDTVTVDVTLEIDACSGLDGPLAVREIADGEVESAVANREVLTTPPFTHLADLSDRYATLGRYLTEVLGRAAGVPTERADRARQEAWTGDGRFRAVLKQGSQVVFSTSVEPSGLARAVLANGGSIETVDTAETWKPATR